MTNVTDIHSALEQLAALTCTGQPGSAALASQVLHLLADAMEAEGTLVGKLQSDRFIVELLAEREGTGMQPGDIFMLHDQHFRALRTSDTPEGPDGEENIHYRSLLLASRNGVRACIGVPLYRIDGNTYGRLCVVRSDARPPTSAELTLLRFGGRILMTVIEAQELRLKSRTLERQALQDSLTGLPNRVLVRDRLQQSVLAAQRSGDPLSVLAIDLDGFKLVNDTFGHQAGDTLLREVAFRIQHALRESDTFGRVGGDEFIIILPGASAENAALVARKILGTMSRPFRVGDELASVGASIGIAEYPEHAVDPAALVAAADSAMYAAKQRRGGFRIYREVQPALQRNLLPA